MRTRFVLYETLKTSGRPALTAAILCISLGCAAGAQTANAPAPAAAVSAPARAGVQAPLATAAARPMPDARSRFQPPLMARRADMYYESVWGVDSLSVRAVESGELIRFTYRVLDPERSKLLNDKKLEPSLLFPAGRVKLVIPSLEKVGQLRQSSTPEAGKSYWMAFSNPGRSVKRGDRVDVVIGPFHAEGLTVE